VQVLAPVVIERFTAGESRCRTPGGRGLVFQAAPVVRSSLVFSKTEQRWQVRGVVSRTIVVEECDPASIPDPDPAT